jgi:acyl carrier protein
MQDLEKIIISVLKSNEKHSNQTITSKTNLRVDLGMDSFDLAQLTVELEDHYDIDIFEEGNPQTVADILELLKKK